MTPEERAMLQETRDAVLENTRMLQKMQKSGRTNRVLQYSYWGFIVIGSIAAIYLGQFYVNDIVGATNIADGTPAATSTSPGIITNLTNLENELKGLSQ